MFCLKSIKKSFTDDLQTLFSKREILFIWNQWVVKEILKISLTDYFISNQLLINDRKKYQINLFVKHLLKQKPIQYFFGYTYFKGLKINVNSNILIPRPETEELVDIVLKNTNFNKVNSVLDIGTGSGCIAIALKKKIQSHVLALDFDQRILDIAIKNAKQNNVSIDFVLLDILNFEKFNYFPKIDLIVSNPPYVLDSEVPKDSTVRSEPNTAIFIDDNNPLIFYRSICEFGKKYLNSGGKIFFEINPCFANELIILIKKIGYSDMEIIKDFYNKKRFIIVSS